MTGKEKIIELANKRKVFRAEDTGVQPNSARKYLERLVKDGQIERVGYGLYSLAGTEFSETQSIVEMAARVPTAVLCLLSALRYHDLTTQNPFEIWLAIERNTWIPKVDTVFVRIFRFSSKVYNAGIESHSIDGVAVKVYSPAKTIADCFYYQKTVGPDVALEALRDAWRQRKVTMEELFHFAEVRNVKSTMLPYLNTLT